MDEIRHKSSQKSKKHSEMALELGIEWYSNWTGVRNRTLAEGGMDKSILVLRVVEQRLGS
jgi:hypothetical protein